MRDGPALSAGGFNKSGDSGAPGSIHLISSVGLHLINVVCLNSWLCLKSTTVPVCGQGGLIMFGTTSFHLFVVASITTLEYHCWLGDMGDYSKYIFDFFG